MNRPFSILSKIRAKARSIDPGFQFDSLMGHVHASEYNGSPNGALTGRLFELCWDYTNSDVYINTNGATAWTKIID